MSVLQVFLFGKFRVLFDQQPLAGFESQRAQQLFCYLVLNLDRPHPREALADLLWGDENVDQPNRCLRKALWQLRAALDAPAEPLCDRVLLIEPEWVQIHPQAELWIDAADFERCFRRVQSVSGRDLDAPTVQALRGAAEGYRGGLQESWYQDWYLYERERVQHMYLIMLDKLMGFCESHQCYEDGIAYGDLILRCESARERTHWRLMRLHYLAGDRTAALRQYNRCVRALDSELGVSPARRTVMLYQQIQDDRLSDRASIPAVSDPRSPLSTVLGRLEHLHDFLAEVQHRVYQDIQAIELTMSDQR